MLHKVSVAKITDPKVGESVTVSYDEPCTVIFISYGEMYFESEAYHLETWCEAHGYDLVIKSFELEI